MDSNQCQNRTNIDGTDGSSCTYSSHSTLPPCSECSHDIPSRHETSHPFLCSIPPQNNQEQPAARSCLPPVDTQLSISSSPAASYPEAPSSASETLIGIVARNERDQNPHKGGRLLSESESDSDCESRAGMEGEGNFVVEGQASEMSTEAGYNMMWRSQPHLLHLFCKSIGCWERSEGTE